MLVIKIRTLYMYQFKPPSKAKTVSSHNVTDYNTHVTSTFFSEYVIQYTKIIDSNVRKLMYFSIETENILSRIMRIAVVCHFCHQSWKKSLRCCRWHNKIPGSCSTSSRSLSGTNNDTTIDINWDRKIVVE